VRAKEGVESVQKGRSVVLLDDRGSRDAAKTRRLGNFVGRVGSSSTTTFLWEPSSNVC
jgi:hypothetical protein